METPLPPRGRRPPPSSNTSRGLVVSQDRITIVQPDRANKPVQFHALYMYIWLAAICTIFPPFLEIYLSTYESHVAFLKLAFGYKKRSVRQKKIVFQRNQQSLMNYAKSCFLNFICFFQIIRFFIIYNFFTLDFFRYTRAYRACRQYTPYAPVFFKRQVYYIIWKTIETIFAISSILYVN